MRAHDPPDREATAREARARQAQPGRSGTDSAPPAGSVAAMLALQRRAGNAAVAQAVPSSTPSIQRVTEDELHREPPGPSVRVRGPRESKAKDRATTQVRNQGIWNAVSEEYEATTGQTSGDKQRITLDTDLTSLIDMSPDRRGQQLGQALTLAAEEAGIPRWDGDHRRAPAEMVEQLGRRDPVTRPYWEAQSARDHKLANDAVTRAERYEQESGADKAQALRKEMATMLSGIEMPAADATDTFLTLFRDGLAIAGQHKNEPFFSWATENMARLRKNGVRTLYIEVLREDAHQRLVDEYLDSGQMSPELDNFCKNYEGPPNYVNFAAFLAAAQAAGMRVKGLGGRPARRLGTEPHDFHRRAVMQNTYGEQVVRRDRLAQGDDAGKYLVEVGEAHARTHTYAGQPPTVVGGVSLPEQFPGIHELLDIPAVRLEDSTDGGQRFRLL